MAAAFRPVNSPLAAEVAKEDVMTTKPSSPKPSTAPAPAPQAQPQPQSAQSPDDSKASTRAAFSTPMAGQKPLPTSSFPQAVQVPEPAESGLRRDIGQRFAKSPKRTLMDIDMDDSDGEAGTVEDGAGSDDESVNADGSRSHKKKKSQRFYCTDYPPCHLSFTRSEHLARHIRKHTGERPFQCHCSRRFSRLDNLRQHAQTVHVNEDIPIDSLAATGSRFQRQIRTERVRQAGNRARASTGGAAAGPVRGHSKSYSTSSIAAVGSTYSPQADPRRRPPPLVMAADTQSRLSLDSYRSNTDSTFSYRPQSPGDFSTPTSATFSTAQSSPRWGSGMVSPSSHSRSHSLYAMNNRTPGRRLSVPSGTAPFQFGHTPIQVRSTFGPLLNSSNSGAFSPPNNNLILTPPLSTSGWPDRRESTSGTNEEAWRRRTWHPDSRSYNCSAAQLSAVISQSVRPNPPPPIANPTNPQSTLRLPGIESFDPIPHRSITPPRRNLSPMAVDPESIPRHAIMEAVPSDERRNLNMYDVSLQRGLTRLDIGHKTPPRDSAGAWASEVNKAVLAQAEHVRLNPPMVRFEEQPRPGHQTPNSTMADRSIHQHTMSAPSLAPTKESKRHGWYHGPVTVHHEHVQQPQQESRGPHVDRMVHPNFNGFTGFPAREPPPHQQQQDRPNNSDPLRRLEALVAVATSEGSTATAY